MDVDDPPLAREVDYWVEVVFAGRVWAARIGFAGDSVVSLSLRAASTSADANGARIGQG